MTINKKTAGLLHWPLPKSWAKALITRKAKTDTMRRLPKLPNEPSAANFIRTKVLPLLCREAHLGVSVDGSWDPKIDDGPMLPADTFAVHVAGMWWFIKVLCEDGGNLVISCHEPRVDGFIRADGKKVPKEDP